MNKTYKILLTYLLLIGQGHLLKPLNIVNWMVVEVWILCLFEKDGA